MPFSTNAPSSKQLTYIASLSRSRSVTFNRPKTKQAASEQIAALLAMPAGHTARSIEQHFTRSVTAAPAAVEIRDDEVEGYGASCRWAHRR
jgi:TorA maturation chaperone TorD